MGFLVHVTAVKGRAWKGRPWLSDACGRFVAASDKCMTAQRGGPRDAAFARNSGQMGQGASPHLPGSCASHAAEGGACRSVADVWGWCSDSLVAHAPGPCGWLEERRGLILRGNVSRLAGAGGRSWRCALRSESGFGIRMTRRFGRAARGALFRMVPGAPPRLARSTLKSVHCPEFRAHIGFEPRRYCDLRHPQPPRQHRIQGAWCSLRCLPACSPDRNRIKVVMAKLRALGRTFATTIAARTPQDARDTCAMQRLRQLDRGPV